MSDQKSNMIVALLFFIWSNVTASQFVALSAAILGACYMLTALTLAVLDFQKRRVDRAVIKITQNPSEKS